jgi:8-oxo-dGTP pyrophosphatase MutT (NUDIX family)
MQTSAFSYNDAVARLSLLLESSQSESQSARQLAPQLSYGRHRGPAGPGVRSAAVIALLYPARGQWLMPLILRPASMTDHAGQISLPGGRIDDGESAPDCALRELQEELGVPTGQVRVLGPLAPTFVFASNFTVTPFVGTCRARPNFSPNPSEVERLFELPLEHLVEASCLGDCLIQRGRLQFRAPTIVAEEFDIWGATGVILGELIPLLACWLPRVTP